MQEGVKKESLSRVADLLSLIKMLDSGRLDLFSYGDLTTKWVLKINGLNTGDYENVYTLKEIKAYYAFNKETPDSLILQFQNVLNELKKKPADGGKSEYEKVLDNYLTNNK